jgi:hypothetical protein
MPKPLVNNKIIYQNINGLVSKHDNYLNQGVRKTDSPTFANLQITGDSTIQGNLFVEGNTTILNTNVTEFEDNILLLNRLETGNGVTLNQSGLEIKRGSLENYRIVYNESDDTFKVGFISNLQTVATREDYPPDNGIMFWNDSLKRLEAKTTISIDMLITSTTNSTSVTTGCMTFRGGIGISKDIWTNGKIYLGGSSWGNESSIWTDTSTNDLKISSKQNLVLIPDENIKIPSNKSLIFGNDLLNIISNSTTNNISITASGHIDFNLNPGKRIRIPNQIPITFATQSDQIYTDSSNNMNMESSQNINLTPGTNRKVAIPVDIGLTFSNNNQQISANLNNDLSILAGNNIKLTPGSQLDVILPFDSGMKFGNSGDQKIFSNSNNELNILSSGDIYITPSSGNRIILPGNIPLVFNNSFQYIMESNGNLLMSSLNGFRMLNRVTVTNTENANNITSASLVVLGGLSIVKNILSKGSIETAVDSSKGLLVSTNNNQVVVRVDTINRETVLTNSKLIINNTTNNTVNINNNFVINSVNSSLTNSLINLNTNSSDSTDFSSAALVVSGGVSIQKKLRVSDVGYFSNTIDMTNTKIRNVQDPVLNQDVATKAYVDLAALRGLYTKESVQIATLEHGDLNTAYTPGTIIDGYTLRLNDRILIKNQNDPVENGMYVIISSGAPTRTPDLPVGDNAAGVFTFIQRGDYQGSTGWICNTPNGDDRVGTNGLTFVQFSGIGQLTVGPGIIKSLNRIDLSVDDTSIEIVSNQLRIKNTAVGTGLTGGSGTTIQTISDQSHVQKVGTLNTGTWQASTIDVQYGGTGNTTFPSGQILFGNVQNAISTDNSLFYDNGNKRLGLGTNSPLYNLHIKSESSSKIFLEADITGSSFNEKPEIILGYNNQQKGFIGLTRNANEYANNIYSNAFVISSDNITQFATNNQSRLTILSNGKIGINTSTPISELQVVGTLNSTNITISDTAQAIFSTQGGSLTAAGGIGIAKNLIVGGVSNFDNTTPSNSASEASVIVKGGVSIKCTQNAVNVGNGGGLTVVGGGSFGGDLYVGGSINGSSSRYTSLTLTATDQAINFSTGSLVTFGGITIKCSTDSTSLTNGGALLVAGGASIIKDVYIGSELKVNKINYNGNCAFDIIENIDNNDNEWKYFGIINDTTISFCEIDFYNCIGQKIDSKPLGLKLTVSINGSICSAKHNYYGDINSSNKMECLIYKDALDKFHLFVNLPPNTKVNVNIKSKLGNRFTIVSEGRQIQPNGTTSGYLNSWSNVYTTDIESNLTYSFGDVTIEGLNFNVADNFPVIGYNNINTVSSRDLGIAFQRYQFSNDSGTGEVVADNYIFEDILPDQTSATNTQIKFSNAANATNDYYIGYWIKIGSSNQVRKIISYNGAQRVAGLDSAWTGANPTNGDTVYFYNRHYTSLYYDGNEQTYKLIYNTRNLDNKAISDYTDLHIKHLKLSDTTPSTNASTGSISTLGGISISNINNSTSCSQGGSFTSLGGASIQKTLYVGNNIGLGQTSFTPSESLHINQTSATLRLENASNAYSYIDFVKTGTNNRFGIVSDSVNNQFSLTSNFTNLTPINSNKALTINSFGYVGINTTTNINSPLTLNVNNFISTNSETGYIGLISGNTNLNELSSRVVLYGNNATGSIGNIDIYSGTSGSISFYTNKNGGDIKRLLLDNDGIVNIFSTHITNSETSGSLVISGGVGVSCTENSINVSNGGSLTIAGGASIKKDVFIGGNLNIDGNLNANGAITTPSITLSNLVNCSVTGYENVKLLRVSNEAILSFSIFVTPTNDSKNTQIEFNIPQRITNFDKRTDLITSCNGYTDDDNIIPLFNVIGLAVKNTTRGLVKFQSVSTGIHYFTIICRYTIA